MKKFLTVMLLLILPLGVAFSKAKKTPHPFDLFDHEMHTGLFEMGNISCDLCHADPDSFNDRSKINRLGCHTCHNNPNPPLPGTQECTVCHIGGKFPKPESHKTGWIGKHENYAKQNPEECAQCHRDRMFCIDCHKRRDTVQTRVHSRNFKFFHSIEARANPRKCDACHTVDYCQQCHSGRGN